MMILLHATPLPTYEQSTGPEKRRREAKGRVARSSFRLLSRSLPLWTGYNRGSSLNVDVDKLQATTELTGTSAARRW